MQGLRLDDIPFAKRMDYIRLTAITYQSFGLDKKIPSLATWYFFGRDGRIRTYECNSQSVVSYRLTTSLYLILDIKKWGG